tara:strand:+ start:205 stop:369 length:165 start_codon:yes stop_codon:yes gene_type:complete
MEQKSYAVRYRDDQSIYHKIDTFASDSYQAKILAMQKNKYLSDHPHAIDNISLN